MLSNYKLEILGSLYPMQGIIRKTRWCFTYCYHNGLHNELQRSSSEELEQNNDRNRESEAFLDNESTEEYNLIPEKFAVTINDEHL